jgi:Domain of unknown function (DUF4167)
MRPGQHSNNNKRGRNRNRGRHTGGGSGGGGGGGNYNGNPANRVFDSNGPDVKLRGTAQTVAEKYMQLGRDAQASSDIVMAESYFQHSEHYYRLWLANQPAGQPIQFARRTDEEMEEDQIDGVDGDDEMTHGETQREEGAEQPESPAGEGEQRDASSDNGQYRQQQRPREGQRDNQRDGQRDNRERFRPRWPRRNDRPNEQNREEQPTTADVPQTNTAPPDTRDQPREQAGEQAREQESGNWEAPSFLTRPVPAPIAAESSEAEEIPQERAPRARREFKPRRPRNEEVAASEPGTVTPEPTEG